MAPGRGPYRSYRQIPAPALPGGSATAAPLPSRCLPAHLSAVADEPRAAPGQLLQRSGPGASPGQRQPGEAGERRQRRSDASPGKWLKRGGRAGGGAGRARGRARPLCSPGRRREERARTCCCCRRLPARGSGRAGKAAGCPRCPAGLRRGGRRSGPTCPR